MKKALLALFMAGLRGSLLGTPGIVAATAVLFTATDLDDALGPGGDLWQYSYAVSGFNLPQGLRV